MRVDFVTLFPEIVQGMIGCGVVGRAVRNKLVTVNTWNPRDFTNDAYRTVDDRPYGGGPGMVMKVEPVRAAINAAKANKSLNSLVILMSPQGQRLNQSEVGRFSTLDNLVIVSGRYEGIDERLVQTDIDEEWSIGDYVVSGGELPALVLFDAVVRLLPGVLGDNDSALNDSYMEGLLDHPHYTRPPCLDGLEVPRELLSGDHELIRKWRLKQSLGRTWLRRPDLLANIKLDAEQLTLLEEYKQEISN